MENPGNLHTFRKSVKILDATLRDGGIVNSFYFSDDFVKALFKANAAAGVDIMEFGYKVSKKLFDVNKFGKWKFCDEQDIRDAIGGENNTDMLISVMSDVGRVDLKQEVIPKKDSVIDLYRIATYVHQIPSAVEMIEYCHNMGYKTSCNIMAISKTNENNLRQALEIVGQSPVDIIVIVDSFGALYPEEIRRICDMYLEFGDKYNKQIGIHAHNNQQLAFANTIEACAKGVNYLDGTICGMGRGAGNCYTEALLGFLKNPKYKMEPVLKFIREYMNDLKKTVSWGYDTAYLLTGLQNVHPYAAIDFLKAGRNDYEKFIQEILGVD
ncbi:MAG: aldolase catalytic domain-containing protein [Clostridia bacterium]|nr:aldolase catalytic domain-containing protein [Clostridia bacterium]